MIPIDGEHDELSRRLVGRKRNVVHVALTKQHVDIGFVRMLAHGSRKHHCIQLALRDAGSNLRVPAERS